MYCIPRIILNIDVVAHLYELAGKRSCVWMRHPDLENVDDWDVKEPLLQVRGIWKKLPLQLDIRPRGRRANVMWIWRSRLYVFAGSTNITYTKTAPIFDTW